MADLYWQPPTNPGLFDDGNNWRVGSISGPVHGLTPSSADNVNFVAGGTANYTCLFNGAVSVSSFIAQDTGGTFSFNAGVPSCLIQIQFTFDISEAGVAQAAFFGLLTSSPSFPAVQIEIKTTGSSAGYVNAGPHQLGLVRAQKPISGGVTYLKSKNTSGTYPFKVYSLWVDTGRAEFVVADCDGAHFGHPTTVLTTAPALFMTGIASSKSFYAQFPASKPIIVYGNIQGSPGPYPGNYSMNWATDTRLEFRGVSSAILIDLEPVPAVLGNPIQPQWLPNVYNYLGENASGGVVSSGGVLVINTVPVYFISLTCTAAGSVSGSFDRRVWLGTTAPLSFPDLLISNNSPYSGATPFLTLAGDGSNQVTLRSNNPGVQAIIKVTSSAPPLTVNATYTTIQDIFADTTGGTQYLAYTQNGNVNGGNNTNWQFTPATGGFLAFFM